jgi:SAM-dependent methyltransferase
MMANNQYWLPEWRLRPGEVLDPERACERLVYCLQGTLDLTRLWRRYAWTKSAVRLLGQFDQFRGKNVFEFGPGPGRMSCLFAALGARVTSYDLVSMQPAREEARRWGCEDRVHFESYDGDFSRLPKQKYDIVFTKSAISFADKNNYEELLRALKKLLTPGGTGYFLENVTTPLLYQIRRNITYRDSCWEVHDFGITHRRVTAFCRIFDWAEIKRNFGLIWTIRAKQAM